MSDIHDKQSFGAAGIVVATAGAIAVGDYCCLDCVTDVVLSVFTSSLVTGTITGITLPAGTKIFVPFTAATCVSGTMIAYKGVNP